MDVEYEYLQSKGDVYHHSQDLGSRNCPLVLVMEYHGAVEKPILLRSYVDYHQHYLLIDDRCSLEVQVAVVDRMD